VLALYIGGTHCGAEPPPKPRVAQKIVRDAGAAAIDASDPLAVDAQSLAPGMREIVRRDIDIGEPASISVPVSADADTCVRVAVRSQGAFFARLLAKSGALGEGQNIGEKGPICVRKGDSLSVEISAADAGAPGRTRIVVWSSP